VTPSPRSGAQHSEALGGLLASGSGGLLPLSDEAFFAPQGSAWSPAEHIRHLTKSARPLVMALGLPRWILRLRFGRPRGASRSFEEMKRVYLGQLAAGATAGRYTPRPEALPADPPARRREIMDAWARVTVELQNAIGRWPEAALEDYRLPHPVLGLLTVREILSFTVYHTSHHLGRIAERHSAAGV
jgi:hypothetical protein